MIPSGSKKKQNWKTPGWVIDAVEQWCGPIALDVAADASNAVCENYYSVCENGLVQPWEAEGGITWCNPPFQNVLPWVQKAIHQANFWEAEIVMLLNSATDTEWFHRLLLHIKTCDPISLGFIQGRIPFIDPDTNQPMKGNPKGQILVMFNSGNRAQSLANEISRRIKDGSR